MFDTLFSRLGQACKLSTLAFITIGGAVAVSPSQANDYPTRPIQVVIPNPPGGGTDTLGRLILNATTKKTGWNLVAVNKPGAGGAIGLDLTARSAPDGYTIALGETSNLAVNPSLYKKLSYNPSKDFSPVLLVGTVPLVMIVPGNSPYKAAAEFIAAAKTKELVMGSAGNGTVGHLAGAMMEQATQTKLLHVPYKGAAAALNDLIGGRVSVFFGSYPSVRNQIESGKVRALAVTSAERLAALPNVPTLKESGLENFDAVVWYGFVAPAKTGAAQVEALAKGINETLATEEMRNRLASDGMKVDMRTGKEFGAFIAQEQKKWGDVVKSAKVQID